MGSSNHELKVLNKSEAGISEQVDGKVLLIRGGVEACWKGLYFSSEGSFSDLQISKDSFWRADPI